MTRTPFNLNFWLTLIAVIFAGGLVYGQAAGLNSELDKDAAALASWTAFSPERIQLRRIDLDVQNLVQEPWGADFTEVDGALEEL